MADDEPQPAAEQDLDSRVGALETGQQTMAEKLDQILGIVTGGGHEQDGAGQPDKPGDANIAHEIRAQLDARDARKAEEGKHKSLAEQVAEIKTTLTEKPPEPMPRRVERLMGWR